MDNRFTLISPVPGINSGRIYYFIPDCVKQDRPSPLFVFMHGGAQATPDDAPYEMYLHEKKGVLQPHISHAPFIVAAPSAPPAIDGKRWNRVGTAKYIEAVIEDACSRFCIDRDRIIFGGHSMGGYGAYHLGQILADRAAGVFLSSGAWVESDFRSLYGTPAYILHGKYDCAANYHEQHPEPRHHDWCGVSHARAAHELMLCYGVEHVFDEHEGGHSLKWEPAQMAFMRFLDWAVKQRRNPYPKKCALVTPCGSGDPDLENRSSSRYLEILKQEPGLVSYDRIQLHGPNVAWTVQQFLQQGYSLEKSWRPGARIIAENLGGNRFVVHAENLSSFAIKLAPAMGDLSRPFIVDAGELGVKALKTEPVTGDSDYCARIVF
ncbi:MAG: hypothetical protein IKP00_17690 [Victivallales bacterium]|nr:hypothetical protein [Victivallales bacterium]